MAMARFRGRLTIVADARGRAHRRRGSAPAPACPEWRTGRDAGELRGRALDHPRSGGAEPPPAASSGPTPHRSTTMPARSPTRIAPRLLVAPASPLSNPFRRKRTYNTNRSVNALQTPSSPGRKISVNGSVNVPGWESLITLSWVTAYHSFSGEVEASNTPTIRRLTPSSRHQLPRIAHFNARLRQTSKGRRALVAEPFSRAFACPSLTRALK
jgi:hypothetical protein